MKNPRARILVTLAASDARLEELYQFFRWVNEAGPDRVMRYLQDIRYDLDKFDDFPVSYSKSTRFHDPGPPRKVSSERVERLLSETGLAKAEIAQLLLNELRNKEPALGLLPAYRKVAFGTWLDRVGQKVGPNALLEAASRVRNKVAHKSSAHWPLRRD